MNDSNSLKRRDFLRAVGAASAAGVAAAQDSSGTRQPAAPSSPAEQRAAKRVRISLKINGEPHELTVDSRTTLVDLLRENLQMFGTKKGCDHGSCGACTVHLNGQRVLSCLTLAATIAEWTTKNNKPQLTVYEASQSLPIAQASLAKLFGLNPK